MRNIVLATALILVCTVSGCDSVFGNFRGLPAPLRNDFPYEVIGMAVSHYGGDSFQMIIDGTVHFVVMQGIDSPKPGEPFYAESVAALSQFVAGKTVRLQVVQRDSFEREIAFVTSTISDASDPTKTSEVDIGLEMIRQGWGHFDGSDFPDAENYRVAEQEAKQAELGMWATVAKQQ